MPAIRGKAGVEKAGVSPVGIPVGSEVAVGNAGIGVVVLAAKLDLDAGMGIAVTLDASEPGRVNVSS